MSRGNLLVIMSDEHQARAMGCAGHPLVQTPNLDALAARAVRFSDASTPSPICVPARAAFATGRYVHQTRLWDNAMPYDGTIPGRGHALQSAGVPVAELFDLVTDPEETVNLAADPAHAATMSALQQELRRIVDQDAVDAQAFADQEALIRRHGGRAAALALGAPGATPPPGVAR